MAERVSRENLEFARLLERAQGAKSPAEARKLIEKIITHRKRLQRQAKQYPMGMKYPSITAALKNLRKVVSHRQRRL